jgi:hypothetical protein
MLTRILVRRVVGLVGVCIASSVLLVGCPDPREVAGVGFSGCERVISGAPAVTRPETSKLDCAAINSLVSSIPSKPENYLMESDPAGFFWKCRYYGMDHGPALIRCEHDKRHFSIVKSLK